MFWLSSIEMVANRLAFYLCYLRPPQNLGYDLCWRGLPKSGRHVVDSGLRPRSETGDLRRVASDRSRESMVGRSQRSRLSSCREKVKGGYLGFTLLV